MSRTKKSLKERFFKHIDKEGKAWTDPDTGVTSPCWEWKGIEDKQYPRIEDDAGKTIYGHRYSWEYHNSPIPPGECVCHKCDHPRCVNPDHLFTGPVSANVADRVKKGRSARMYGTSNPQSKLTPEKVQEIRDAIARGEKSLRGIAREYDVKHPTITNIRDGITWSQV